MHLHAPGTQDAVVDDADGALELVEHASEALDAIGFDAILVEPDGEQLPVLPLDHERGRELEAPVRELRPSRHPAGDAVSWR